MPTSRKRPHTLRQADPAPEPAMTYAELCQTYRSVLEQALRTELNSAREDAKVARALADQLREGRTHPLIAPGEAGIAAVLNIAAVHEGRADAANLVLDLFDSADGA